MVFASESSITRDPVVTFVSLTTELYHLPPGHILSYSHGVCLLQVVHEGTTDRLTYRMNEE